MSKPSTMSSLVVGALWAPGVALFVSAAERHESHAGAPTLTNRVLETSARGSSANSVQIRLLPLPNSVEEVRSACCVSRCSVALDMGIPTVEGTVRQQFGWRRGCGWRRPERSSRGHQRLQRADRRRRLGGGITGYTLWILTTERSNACGPAPGLRFWPSRRMGGRYKQGRFHRFVRGWLQTGRLGQPRRALI